MWNKIIAFFMMLSFVCIGIGGTLTGKITNGTNGGIVPSELKVFLNVYKKEGKNITLISSETFTKTNRNGEFIFRELTIKPDIFYEPMVTYKNVKYYGQMVQPTEDKPNVRSDVKIFETTTSDSAIQVIRHHILLLPVKGILNVREIMVMENRSDRTYVGQEPTASGKFRTITFRLPKQAKDIQLGEGVMSCCIEFEKDGFYDTMEFPPGQKQITFDYRLDVDKKEMELVKSITLPTQKLDFIPMEPSLQVFGEGLELQQINNDKVRMYVAYNFPKGAQVKVRLAGLAPEPMNPGFILLGLFMGLLFIGGVFALRKFKQINTVMAGAKANTRVPFPQTSADQLIREIAILDEMYDEKQIGKIEYEQKREELKKQLKSLIKTEKS